MSEKIENLLGEDRTFDPPSSIVENANATQEWFDLANEDRLAYWQKQALERITWYKEPKEILDDSDAPFYKWFEDGVTNTCYNALDIHIDLGRGQKTGLIYDSPITGNKVSSLLTN